MSAANIKAGALVLGSDVNGYSVIQELHSEGVRDIVLFDDRKLCGAFSNRICKYERIDQTSESLNHAIRRLREHFDYIVIFPTNDQQIRNLHAIYDDIAPFCFIPFNRKNAIKAQDKYVQYSYCEQLGIPYPKTVSINDTGELDQLRAIEFPVLIKPKRKDAITSVFRSLMLEDENAYRRKANYLASFTSQGIQFLASEVIPGDGSQIYAYVAYRDRDGRILSEWTGKKLSQCPNEFGVFASASNEAPETVREQGRVLLEGMDLQGINEPEFKYDRRDGKFKLMEINLRSMMWNRIGTLSGVNVHYTQWLDALGLETPHYEQVKDRRIHLVCYRHEALNVVSRSRYLRVFLYNLFRGDETHFAVLDRHDLKPFAYDFMQMLMGPTKARTWLRILRLRS